MPETKTRRPGGLQDTKPKTRDGLELVEIDGEALVWDGEGYGLHYLNGLGTLVYQLCDGKGTVKETAADISETFGVPLKEVQQDVQRLVREFRDLGIIERKASRRGNGTRQPEPKREREELIYHDVRPST